MKKQREADGLAVHLADQRLSGALFKHPLPQQLLRRHHLPGHLLILRQLPDKGQHRRQVGLHGGTDCHFALVCIHLTDFPFSWFQ